MTNTSQMPPNDQSTSPTTPKRILALDGGGIRGVIATRVLVKIESILKKKIPNYTCLGDYFDFMGGTSTGSLIAVALAKGLSAEEVFDIYQDRGREIFSPTFWKGIPLANQLATKYQAAPMEKVLQEILTGTDGKELTLGSTETNQLKSYVMLVAKNATEGQTVFFVGHPENRFYEHNKTLPLWKLARASSAAPTYFPPKSIQLRYQKQGSNEIETVDVEFIDGGMSPYNNPSFQLFLEATKKGYGMEWPRGKDNLLLISIGTGSPAEVIPYEKARTYSSLNWASYGIGVLMEGANLQQNLLMDLISQDRAKEENKDNIPFEPLLTYHRYNLPLTQGELNGLGLNDIDAQSIIAIDNVDNVAALKRIGDAIAEQEVHEEDFEGFF